MPRTVSASNDEIDVPRKDQKGTKGQVVVVVDAKDQDVGYDGDAEMNDSRSRVGGATIKAIGMGPFELNAALKKELASTYGTDPAVPYDIERITPVYLGQIEKILVCVAGLRGVYDADGCLDPDENTLLLRLLNLPTLDRPDLALDLNDVESLVPALKARVNLLKVVLPAIFPFVLSSTLQSLHDDLDEDTPHFHAHSVVITRFGRELLSWAGVSKKATEQAWMGWRKERERNQRMATFDVVRRMDPEALVFVETHGEGIGGKDPQRWTKGTTLKFVLLLGLVWEIGGFAGKGWDDIVAPTEDELELVVKILRQQRSEVTYLCLPTFPTADLVSPVPLYVLLTSWVHQIVDRLDLRDDFPVREDRGTLVLKMLELQNIPWNFDKLDAYTDRMTLPTQQQFDIIESTYDHLNDYFVEIELLKSIIVRSNASFAQSDVPASLIATLLSKKHYRIRFLMGFGDVRLRFRDATPQPCNTREFLEYCRRKRSVEGYAKLTTIDKDEVNYWRMVQTVIGWLLQSGLLDGVQWSQEDAQAKVEGLIEIDESED